MSSIAHELILHPWASTLNLGLCMTHNMALKKLLNASRQGAHRDAWKF